MKQHQNDRLWGPPLPTRKFEKRTNKGSTTMTMTTMTMTTTMTKTMMMTTIRGKNALQHPQQSNKKVCQERNRYIHIFIKLSYMTFERFVLVCDPHNILARISVLCHAHHS